MPQCQLEENKARCTCPYTDCERHGACCKCAAYHRDCGDLPMCFRAKKR
jgi:hypothetical protein